MVTNVTRNNVNNLWLELDESKWKPIPSLGTKWIGKWTHSHNSYTLIVFDGVDIWGEHRKESYIKDKAEEWAACLESGVKELSDLVLSRLEDKTAELRIIPDDGQHKLTIELTAFLDQLPYNWLFYMAKLSPEIIEHHWTIPVAATFEFMSQRMLKLEEEIKKKDRQLEEFLPPQSISRKDKEVLISNCMDSAVQTVTNKGVGNTLSSHLRYSSNLSKLIAKRKLSEASRLENHNSGNIPHNKPKTKSKKHQKGAICEDISHATKESEDARRAQIQALTQQPVIPSKKKKKLNI